MVRIRFPPVESPRLAGFCPPTARSRLFARVCGPGRCSAVSRDGYRAVHGADRREYLCRAKFQYRSVDEAVASMNSDRAQAKPSTDRCSCQASGRRECASSLSAVKSRG